MKVTKKLKDLVIQEATALRQHATDEQKDKLDFYMLDPTSKCDCIYGQMTGNCYNSEASELIIHCAERVYKPANKEGNLLREVKLNGAPKAVKRRQVEYHSPIEIFIFNDKSNENKRRLIDYIKGDIDTLSFI